MLPGEILNAGMLTARLFGKEEEVKKSKETEREKNVSDALILKCFVSYFFQSLSFSPENLRKKGSKVKEEEEEEFFPFSFTILT